MSRSTRETDVAEKRNAYELSFLFGNSMDFEVEVKQHLKALDPFLLLPRSQNIVRNST